MAKTLSLLTKNRGLLLLFIINVLFTLSYSMITSLQSVFVESLGADALEIGLVISVQGLFSTLLMIPSGLLMEKIGGKRMLLISPAIAMASLIFYTFSKSWQELLPWAAVYGSVFSMFIVTRMALIAHHSSTESRATTYGLMNVTWSISDLLGPIIAGILADMYGWNPLFYSALLVSFLSIIPALFLRDSRISREHVKQEDPLPSFNSGSLRVIFLVSFTAFTMCVGIGVVNPIIPLYLIEVFNISKTQVGFFLSIGLGLSTLLTQIPSGLVADKYGSKKVMLLSALITPILYILAPLIGHYLLLAAVYLLINASWSMTWPSSMALLVDSVPKSKRSIAIGIRQTAIRLGLTIGPLFGGFLWHMYKLGQMMPTLLFYISAIFFGLSVPAILFLNEKVRTTR